VQAAHDLHSSEGFLRGILRANGHQAGHFLFCEADFLAAKLRKRKIFHLERLTAGLFGKIVSVGAFDSSGH
jgi:hypothetical protein